MYIPIKKFRIRIDKKIYKYSTKMYSKFYLLLQQRAASMRLCRMKSHICGSAAK